MTRYSNAIRYEERSSGERLWIDAQHWVDCAGWLKDQGLVRCEWLTAAHLVDDQFQVTLCVSDVLSNE